MPAEAEHKALLLNPFFDEAVLRAQRRLQISPDDAEALYDSGLALARVGEIDFAITLLNRALNAGKDRFAVHWRRGYLEFLRGNFSAAVDDLVKATALKNDPYVRQLLQASVIPALPRGMKWAGMTGRYVSLRYTLPHRLDSVQDVLAGIRQLLSDDSDAVVKLVDAETCPDRHTVVDDETSATVNPIMQTGPHITNPLFIGSIKDARVFNSRLWNRHGDLVLESVSADMAIVEVDRLQEENILYETADPLVLCSASRPAENVVTIEETCVLLDNEWAGNYTHWHLQMLAAYSMLREAIVAEGMRILITAPDGFRRDSLAAAGIPSNSIHCMQPDTVYRLSRLIFPSFAWAFHVGNIFLFPRQTMEIFQRIRAAVGPAADAGRRIYVARFEARGRSLENERELADRLSTLGFQIIVAEKLSFAEQVKIFAEADVVVGPHGSGLTNCLYCRPGAIAIELTHRDFFYTPPLTLPPSHFVIEPSIPLPTPQIPSWGYGHLFATAGLKGVQYLEQNPAYITISSYYGTIPNFTWRIDIDKAVSSISRFLE